MQKFRGFQIGQLPRRVYEWMQAVKAEQGLTQRQVVVAGLVALAALRDRDPEVFEAAMQEAMRLCPRTGPAAKG